MKSVPAGQRGDNDVDNAQHGLDGTILDPGGPAFTVSPSSEVAAAPAPPVAQSLASIPPPPLGSLNRAAADLSLQGAARLLSTTASAAAPVPAAGSMLPVADSGLGFSRLPPPSVSVTNVASLAGGAGVVAEQDQDERDTPPMQPEESTPAPGLQPTAEPGQVAPAPAGPAAEVKPSIVSWPRASAACFADESWLASLGEPSAKAPLCHAAEDGPAPDRLVATAALAAAFESSLGTLAAQRAPRRRQQLRQRLIPSWRR